jgi:hypothetical protein
MLSLLLDGDSGTTEAVGRLTWINSSGGGSVLHHTETMTQTQKRRKQPHKHEPQKQRRDRHRDREGETQSQPPAIHTTTTTTGKQVYSEIVPHKARILQQAE